ncbi:LOW QUALITY PROTEIN: hypothetical protein, conserved [Eimeria necatrix]|uniref:Proteophosphoglycan 5, related n=1 Tax=Eimeria necatrix TaxID=51315 RepID=U6MVK4_9EIME|nr:LOW QUALITY PROTEIN: hypothetical protein, conserved [Eimeria necatrix]CDJ65745.1 hypothetical protein, conserved [Eimeria necatrix]
MNSPDYRFTSGLTSYPVAYGSRRYLSRGFCLLCLLTLCTASPKSAAAVHKTTPLCDVAPVTTATAAALPPSLSTEGNEVNWKHSSSSTSIENGDGCTTSNTKGSPPALKCGDSLAMSNSLVSPRRSSSLPVFLKVSVLVAAVIGTAAVVFLVLRCSQERRLHLSQGHNPRAISDLGNEGEGPSTRITACVNLRDEQEAKNTQEHHGELSEHQVRRRARSLFREALELCDTGSKLLPLLGGGDYLKGISLIVGLTAAELASVGYVLPDVLDGGWSATVDAIAREGRLATSGVSRTGTYGNTVRKIRRFVKFLANIHRRRPKIDATQKVRSDLLFTSITVAREAISQSKQALDMLTPWSMQNLSVQALGRAKGRDRLFKADSGGIVPRKVSEALLRFLGRVRRARITTLRNHPAFGRLINRFGRRLFYPALSEEERLALAQSTPVVVPLSVQLRELNDISGESREILAQKHEDALAGRRSITPSDSDGSTSDSQERTSQSQHGNGAEGAVEGKEIQPSETCELQSMRTDLHSQEGSSTSFPSTASSLESLAPPQSSSSDAASAFSLENAQNPEIYAGQQFVRQIYAALHQLLLRSSGAYAGSAPGLHPGSFMAGAPPETMMPKGPRRSALPSHARASERSLSLSYTESPRASAKTANPSVARGQESYGSAHGKYLPGGTTQTLQVYMQKRLEMILPHTGDRTGTQPTQYSKGAHGESAIEAHSRTFIWVHSEPSDTYGELSRRASRYSSWRPWGGDHKGTEPTEYSEEAHGESAKGDHSRPFRWVYSEPSDTHEDASTRDSRDASWRPRRYDRTGTEPTEYSDGAHGESAKGAHLRPLKRVHREHSDTYEEAGRRESREAYWRPRRDDRRGTEPTEYSDGAHGESATGAHSRPFRWVHREPSDTYKEASRRESREAYWRPRRDDRRGTEPTEYSGGAHGVSSTGAHSRPFRWVHSELSDTDEEASRRESRDASWRPRRGDRTGTKPTEYSDGAHGESAKGAHSRPFRWIHREPSDTYKEAGRRESREAYWRPRRDDRRGNERTEYSGGAHGESATGAHSRPLKRAHREPSDAYEEASRRESRDVSWRPRRGDRTGNEPTEYSDGAHGESATGDHSRPFKRARREPLGTHGEASRRASSDASWRPRRGDSTGTEPTEYSERAPGESAAGASSKPSKMARRETSDTYGEVSRQESREAYWRPRRVDHTETEPTEYSEGPPGGPATGAQSKPFRWALREPSDIYGEGSRSESRDASWRPWRDDRTGNDHTEYFEGAPRQSASEASSSHSKLAPREPSDTYGEVSRSESRNASWRPWRGDRTETYPPDYSGGPRGETATGASSSPSEMARREPSDTYGEESRRESRDGSWRPWRGDSPGSHPTEYFEGAPGESASAPHPKPSKMARREASDKYEEASRRASRFTSWRPWRDDRTGTDPTEYSEGAHGETATGVSSSPFKMDSRAPSGTHGEGIRRESSNASWKPRSGDRTGTEPTQYSEGAPGETATGASSNPSKMARREPSDTHGEGSRRESRDAPWRPWRVDRTETEPTEYSEWPRGENTTGASSNISKLARRESSDIHGEASRRESRDGSWLTWRGDPTGTDSREYSEGAPGDSATGASSNPSEMARREPSDTHGEGTRSESRDAS